MSPYIEDQGLEEWCSGDILQVLWLIVKDIATSQNNNIKMISIENLIISARLLQLLQHGTNFLPHFYFCHFQFSDHEVFNFQIG